MVGATPVAWLAAIVALGGGHGLSASLAAPAESSPEVAWERRELGDAIAAAAEELPHTLREVFVLSKLEGLSPREIARIVGIGPITVRTRLFRAKHLMRKKLRAFRRSRR